MENCSNCKHARDKFLNEDTTIEFGLFYCEANEEIYLWNLVNHRCPRYEEQK